MSTGSSTGTAGTVTVLVPGTVTRYCDQVGHEYWDWFLYSVYRCIGTATGTQGPERQLVGGRASSPGLCTCTR